jgi:hypothetical protein
MECITKLLSVPVHPSLTDDEVSYVMDHVVEAAG